MLTRLERLPAPFRLLVYALLAVVVVIALALGVDKLGGFDESLQLGHFHFDVGTASGTAAGSTGSTALGRAPGSSRATGSTGADREHGHHGHGKKDHGDQGEGDQGD